MKPVNRLRLTCLLGSLAVAVSVALNIWLLLVNAQRGSRPTEVEEFLMNAPPGMSEGAFLENLPLFSGSDLRVGDDRRWVEGLGRDITNRARVRCVSSRGMTVAVIYIGEDERLEAIRFEQLSE
jgi:hypothetical protein